MSSSSSAILLVDDEPRNLDALEPILADPAYRRELAELNEKLEERVKERTSELEKSEAALRGAALRKDEFLAVLAHELRNPLAPLRAGVGLLLRQQASNPGATRTLATMNRQLDHIVRLIDDLLAVASARPPLRRPSR